jgi:hypothetical protein
MIYRTSPMDVWPSLFEVLTVMHAPTCHNQPAKNPERASPGEQSLARGTEGKHDTN